MIEIADRLAYRIEQVLGYVFGGDVPAVPQSAMSSLLPGTSEVFRHLSAGDQRHLLAVHALLIEQQASEDVLRAGLLHDIGKVYHGQRIGTASRCLKVVMGTVAPRSLQGILQRPAPPRWGAGLWIAGNHASIGSHLLGELGYSERVCWLVEHHEHGSVTDRGLAALIAADNSRMTVPKR